MNESRIPRLTGLLVAAGGAVVLAGWIFNIEVLRRPLAGGPSMKVNTALAFILAGMALRTETPGTWTARVLGAAVALIGTLTLVEIAFGWNLNIDELMVLDRAATLRPPGQMAPTTAFCLMALGLALTGSPQRFRLAQPLTLIALIVSSLALIGYIYHAEALYAVSDLTAIAVHTAVLLVVLAIGVLWRDPPVGIMAVVRADDLGGLAARRLLLLAFVAPVLFGWLRLEGQRVDLYGTNFGAALSIVFTIGLLTAVIWSVAKTIGALDASRQKVVEDLGALTATLEQRVAEQTAALRSREEQLRLVTEKALDAFVAMEANGRICDWNLEAERMFGWPRAHVLGLRVSDLIIPKRDREAHLQGLKRFLVTGQGPVVNRWIKLTALHRDGHEFSVELAISPVQVHKSWRFNAFIRDLSNRAPAEGSSDRRLPPGTEGADVVRID